MSQASTTSTLLPDSRPYRGPDSQPDVEPTVAVKKTAVDFAIEKKAQEQKEQAVLGLTETDTEDKDSTWSKRYSDLRSHTAKKMSALQKQLADLEAEKARMASQLEKAKSGTGSFQPASKEELESWVKENPDAYKIIRTIAAGDQEEEIKALKAEIEALKEAREDDVLDAARKALKALHPDLEEIAASKTFKDWVDTKPKWVYESLFEKMDIDAADDAIKLYKIETGNGKNAKKKTNKNVEAALDISTGGSRADLGSPSADYDFSESQIHKMKDHEFDQYSDAIEKARRAGRILMDMSGRA